MIFIDFMTVFVASLVYVAVKFFWFSSCLFGNVWKRLNSQHKPVSTVLNIIGNWVAAFILSYFFALTEIFLDITSFWDSVAVGFVVWFSFVFTTQITKVLWDRNCFKSFLIENGFFLLGFLLLSIILAG